MSLTLTCTDRDYDYLEISVSLSGSIAMKQVWYIDGDKYDTTTTEKGETSASCVFTSLKGSTSYTILCRVYAYDTGASLDSGSKSFRTSAPPLKEYTAYKYVFTQQTNGTYEYDNCYTETITESYNYNPYAHTPSYTTSVFDAPTVYNGYGNTGGIASTTNTCSGDMKFSYYLPRKITLSNVSATQPDINQLVASVSWSCNMTGGVSFTVSKKKSTSSSWVVGEERASSPCDIAVDNITTYNFLVEVYRKGESSAYTSKSCSLTMKLAKPNKWYWDSGNETAAITGQGDFSSVTYTRWNDFIVRINSTITYCNKKNSTNYSLIPDSCKCTSTDKTLYASDWKIIVGRLNQVTTIPSEIPISPTSGVTKVLGSYFTGLSWALNDCIDSM